jgi:hypothetical protein
MEINLGKTTPVYFTSEANGIHFNHKLCNNLILRSQVIKDLGDLLDCKLYIYQHNDYKFAQGLKMLLSIQHITSSFSTSSSPSVLYCTFVRLKFQHLLSETLLRLLTCLNLKEIKQNLLPSVIQDTEWRM